MENNTVELLRACDSGIKMAVTSIGEVLPSVESEALRTMLDQSRSEHEKLGQRTHTLLAHYMETGKEPSPVAKGMGWLTTNVKLAMEPGDATVAALMTDGCNMGIKNLSGCLNRFADADERSRTVAKDLIRLEEELEVRLRGYLS